MQSVPKNASQTVQGSRIIKPIVPTIKYSAAGRQLRKATIQEFQLNEADKRRSEGLSIHVKDHIRQNIAMASSIKEVKALNQMFKRSVLSK